MSALLSSHFHINSRDSFNMIFLGNCLLLLRAKINTYSFQMYSHGVDLIFFYTILNALSVINK